MATSRQEIRWVLRAQSGDRQALDALFQVIQDPLYRYIVSLVKDRSLAEDILQDVFMLIYRKLSWLEQPKFFRAWTYRIASREAIRVLKKERQWVIDTGDETDPAMVEQPPSVEQMDLQKHLHRLVTHVSPASRAVLVLHYLHEMSLQEVADILGITIGTAKSRMAYGLKILRKRIQENGLIEEL